MMKKGLLLTFFGLCLVSNAQTKLVENIAWIGAKKMNKSFMSEFILSKKNEKIDSLFIEKDIDALTRLNGISKVTFEVKPTTKGNYDIEFTIIEDISTIPYISLWTTEASTAYQFGLYNYNFMGKNNTLGGFYQNNGIASFGFSYLSPFLFNSKFGLEASFQKLGSIEPIFFEATKAKYKYINTAAEILTVYRVDYRNVLKFGVSVFDEDYQYQNGATSPQVPLTLKTEKYLLKINYTFDNLKYDYYLIKGIRNAASFQLVKNSNDFKKNFEIAWNDFSYFERVGSNGNWANRIRLGLSTNDFSPFAPFAVDNNINIRGVGNIIDRGTAAIVLNTEFRQTFFEKKWFVIQGNAFLDAGTWRQPGGNFDGVFEQKNIRVYPGFGLRFIHKTIFNAILRIDYGYGISTNSNKGFVFGIGQYF